MAYSRIDKIVRICTKWNEGKIDGDKAMSKVYDVYQKECLKEWNKKQFRS